MNELPRRVVDRIDASGDCWEWLGHHAPAGYGRVWWEGADRDVHRVVYQVLVRPLRADETLDHLCRNRGCLNPDHLEVVPERLNLLRGYGPPALNARKERCWRGHRFDAVGAKGQRLCLECRSIARRAKYRREHPDVRPRGPYRIARRAA